MDKEDLAKRQDLVARIEELCQVGSSLAFFRGLDASLQMIDEKEHKVKQRKEEMHHVEVEIEVLA